VRKEQELIWKAPLRPSEKLVLLYMEAHRNREARWCEVSFTELSRATGYTRRSVIHVVQRLKARGLVQEGPRGRRNRNSYGVQAEALEREGALPRKGPEGGEAPSPFGGREGGAGERAGAGAGGTRAAPSPVGGTPLAPSPVRGGKGAPSSPVGEKADAAPSPVGPTTGEALSPVGWREGRAFSPVAPGTGEVPSPVGPKAGEALSPAGPTNGKALSPVRPGAGASASPAGLNGEAFALASLRTSAPPSPVALYDLPLSRLLEYIQSPREGKSTSSKSSSKSFKGVDQKLTHSNNGKSSSTNGGTGTTGNRNTSTSNSTSTTSKTGSPFIRGGMGGELKTGAENPGPSSPGCGGRSGTNTGAREGAHEDPLARLEAKGPRGTFLAGLLRGIRSREALERRVEQALGMAELYDLETLKALWEWAQRRADRSPLGLFLYFSRPKTPLPREVCSREGERPSGEGERLKAQGPPPRAPEGGRHPARTGPRPAGAAR